MVIGLACAIGTATSPNAALAKKAAPGAAATHASRPGLTGLWLDHTKRGAVEITRCRSASAARKKSSTHKVAARRNSKGVLCGRIFWLKAPLDKRGRPLTDKLNAKASKRKRPICGLRIIGKVKRMSRRVYDNGWIYDPEKGKYFDVELTLKSNNILQVKGYKGIKLLSKTFLWRRLKPGQLKPCES